MLEEDLPDQFAAAVDAGLGEDVYNADQARAWLDRTGWRFTAHRPLAGPQSLIIAEAR